MKRLLSFFFIQVAVYLLLVFNFRAIAQARLWWVVASDALIAFFAFTVVKRISESQTRLEKFAYVLGSAAGSAAGILVSQYWFGE